MEPLRRLITQQASVRQDTMRGTVLSVNSKNETAHVRIREPIPVQNFVIRGESLLQEPVFTGSTTINLRTIEGFTVGDYIVVDPGLTTEEEFIINNIEQIPSVDNTIQPALNYIKNIVTLNGSLTFPHSDSSQVVSNRNGDKGRPQFAWDPTTQSFKDLSRTTLVEPTTGQIIDELQYNVLRDVPITPSSGSTSYVFPGAPVVLGFPAGSKQQLSIIAPSTVQQNPGNNPNNPPSLRSNVNDSKLHLYLSPPRKEVVNGIEVLIANPRQVDKPSVRVSATDSLPTNAAIYAFDFEIAGDPQLLDEYLKNKGGFKWRIFTVDCKKTGTFKILHQDDLTLLKQQQPLYANILPPLETDVTWGVKTYTGQQSPLTMGNGWITADIPTQSPDGNPAQGLYVTQKARFTVLLQYYGPEQGGKGNCDVIVGAYVCTAGNPDGFSDPVLDARAIATLRFSEKMDVELRATFSPVGADGTVEDLDNEDWNWEPEWWQSTNVKKRKRSDHAINNTTGGALDLYVTEKNLQNEGFRLPWQPEKRAIPQERRFEYIYVYAEKLAVNNDTELDNAGGYFRYGQNAMYHLVNNTDTSVQNGLQNLLYNNLYNDGDANRGKFWQTYYTLDNGNPPIHTLSLNLPSTLSSPGSGAVLYADNRYEMQIQLVYTSTDKIEVRVIKGIYEAPLPTGTTIRHATYNSISTFTTSTAQLDVNPTIDVDNASYFNLGDEIAIGDGLKQNRYTIIGKAGNTLTLSGIQTDHWGVLILRPVYTVVQRGQYTLKSGNQCIVPLRPY